jgi:Ca2+/Na+ antiporter
MHDYGALILGIVCAAAGGELFVRGAVGVARWLRISPGIIGATVVAFGTSSPSSRSPSARHWPEIRDSPWATRSAATS